MRSIKQFFVGGGNFTKRFSRLRNGYRLEKQFRECFGFPANPGIDSAKLADDIEDIKSKLSALGKTWLSAKDAHNEALWKYRQLTSVGFVLNDTLPLKRQLVPLRARARYARRQFFEACKLPKQNGYSLYDGPENYVSHERMEEVLHDVVALEEVF